MTRFADVARTAWGRMQMLCVFGLCIGAGMVLPVALVSIGFHTV